MKTRLKILMLAVALLFWSPPALDADIDGFYSKIIKVAFANGYIRALNSDLNTIRTLQENQIDMKRHVDQEVRKYMSELKSLNSGVEEDKKLEALGGGLRLRSRNQP